MTKSEQIKIKANLRAKPSLIFTVWLLLVIFPYISLSTVSDNILKVNEDRLLTKAKIRLSDELNDFNASLSSTEFITTRLKSFEVDSVEGQFTLDNIKNSIEKHTNSKLTALFYYNSNDDSFAAYVLPTLKNDLGMLSKRTLKNLLTSYCFTDFSSKEKERSESYLEKLLLAAGGINIKAEKAIPILSGKLNLQKMVGYYKVFHAEKNSSSKQCIFCLFREKDLSLKQIIDNAIASAPDSNFQRSIVTLDKKEKEQNKDLYARKHLYTFDYDECGQLYGTSVVSDEMLIRLSTEGSYYPFHTERIKENPPFLKVTANNSGLKHPMRDLMKKLDFPAQLLIFIITLSLIKIAIFGYSGNIKILGRVILCISAAILLPFASFLAAAFYNQHFSEEYEASEAQQYAQLQLDLIDKGVESFIGNKELKIAELRNQASKLRDEKELDKLLQSWLKDNNASAISYMFRNKAEKLIKAKPEDYISQIAKDAKSTVNLGFYVSFQMFDLSGLENLKQIEQKYKFLPSGLGEILSNTGKIYTLTDSEPNAFYSIFPIFEDMKNAKNPNASILIKFDNYNLVNAVGKENPSLFQAKKMGNYVIKNAILPVTKDGSISNQDQMLLAKDFPIEKAVNRAAKILTFKSTKVWKTKNNIVIGTYLNQINSIVISVAEKVSGNHQFIADEILYISIYVIFMVTVLSMVLASIIVKPIRLLQKTSESVTEGDYSKKINYDSNDEFATLGTAFNEMTEALLQKEKMTNYVSKEVINEISQSANQELQTGGELITASILFCALKGKKELSQYSPEEITDIISKLIDTVDEISTINGGQIDKLIEDTVMVVFRQSKNKENIYMNMCKTALAISKQLKEELPDFQITIGAASGEAVSGKIGSRKGKLDYTVIGNPVNLAARLKAIAHKANKTGVIICPYTIRMLQGTGRLNFIQRMTIKGITTRSFPIYELLELRDRL